MDIFKTECLLRVIATLLLVLTVALVGSDSQTKIVVIEVKATYKYLNALVVLLWVDSAAAGYNILQLLLRNVFHSKHKGNLLVSYVTLRWICFLLDQVTVYAVFATCAATSTVSILAITGFTSFEWMELCDKYTKFCIQLGTAVFFGFIASFFLIALSFISAFNLFKLYSPKHYFQLRDMEFVISSRVCLLLSDVPPCNPVRAEIMSDN